MSGIYLNSIQAFFLCPLIIFFKHATCLIDGFKATHQTNVENM